MSFFGMDDQDLEVTFIMTVHCEDGYPVDWFVIGADVNDDVFERRHLKQGMKLRDVPKREKSMDKIAKLVTESMLDVRNERNPERADTRYSIGLIWGSGTIELMCKSSNFETLSCMYDSLNAKRLYNVPMGALMGFWPLPSLIKPMIYQGRGSFVQKLAGMTCKEKLVLQPIEQEVRDGFLNDKLPDMLEFMKYKWEHLGTPTPIQSINCTPPNIKDKKVYQNEESLLFMRSNGKRVNLETLNITLEEALNGMYLNVDSQTPFDEISHDSIISMGWGRNTRFL